MVGDGVDVKVVRASYLLGIFFVVIQIGFCAGELGAVHVGNRVHDEVQMGRRGVQMGGEDDLVAKGIKCRELKAELVERFRNVAIILIADPVQLKVGECNDPVAETYSGVFMIEMSEQLHFISSTVGIHSPTTNITFGFLRIEDVANNILCSVSVFIFLVVERVGDVFGDNFYLCHVMPLQAFGWYRFANDIQSVSILCNRWFDADGRPNGITAP